MLCVNSGFNMFSCLQHILFAHGPWFLKRWGPLSIWNTQGMEKSHYRARAAYFRNTRHGGGFTRSNALHEMFDWFYRTIIGRTLNIRKARESELVRAVQEVSKNKRQCAWKASTGTVGVSRWLQSRSRQGSKWIPRCSWGWIVFGALMNKMDFLTCSCIELSVCTWLCDAMVHVLNSSNKNVQKKKLSMHSRRGGGGGKHSHGKGWRREEGAGRGQNVHTN